MRSMIAAIVLAAGRSRRMGTQKLLLPWSGQTVIGHIVDQVLAAGLNQVCVVVSADRGAVSHALADRSVTLITNPDPDAEMLSSVRCGIRSLPPECDAAMIVLGDQPEIRADTIAALLSAYRRSSAGIIAPIHDGRRGHPLILSSQYFPKVLTRFDGVGLHGLLAEHVDDLLLLEVSSSSVLADLDSPDDYKRAIKGFSGEARQ